MIYRHDFAEPLNLPTCPGGMRCAIVDGRLTVANPWRMHLWIENGVPSKLVRQVSAKLMGCHPVAHFDVSGDELHGIIRNVDDHLAHMLMDDLGIVKTLSRLEVHGVIRPRHAGHILSAIGLHDILAIQCPLKIRIPLGSAIGAAGFAALPPRADVFIEGLVPDWLYLDCIAALPHSWEKRVRLLPVPASRGGTSQSQISGDVRDQERHWNQMMESESHKEKELADILSRIDAVLKNTL